MADVTFNGTTFTGSGTYDQPVNETVNLTVTPTDGATITFTGNLTTTGTFIQNGAHVIFDTGTRNSLGTFRIYNRNTSSTQYVNGSSMTLNGELTVTNFYAAGNIKYYSGTSYVYINDGASLTVTGEFMLVQADKAQAVINQNGGTVSINTSGETAVRIGHYFNYGYPTEYNLKGGVLNIPNAVAHVGWDAYAKLNISGGEANLKGINLSAGGKTIPEKYGGGDDKKGGKGFLNLTGGTLNLGSEGVTYIKKKDGSSYDSSIAPEINLGNGTVKASASHTWASNLTVTLTADKVPTFDIDANKTITIASVVKGSGGLKKIGAGALTLSGANSYSGGTTVSAGKLILTDDALENAQGNFTVDENGTLEFYVAEGTKELSLSAQKELFITGKVIKTGAGELKIDSADPGSIDAHSFVVSSGRLDMKEYFKGSLAVGEQLAPENYLTAIFSPGNSVGALTIDGSGLQDGEYAFTLNPESTLLMEIGGQNTGANDILIVDGDILLGNDSIIRLAMTGDCPLELGESFTAILSAENSEGLDVLGHIQTSDFTELKYETVDYGGNTVYAITGRRFNANEIPEPSTWALLLLGAAGLLYVRKRKN